MQPITLNRILALARGAWLPLVRKRMQMPVPCLETELRLRGGSLKGEREFFAPVYVSNACAEDCDYCGFRKSLRFKRTTQNLEEARREVTHLGDLGYTHIYILTGSFSPEITAKINAVGVQAVGEDPRVQLVLESSPLARPGLEHLLELAGGYGRHTLFMETYDRDTYARLHAEMRWKADPDARLQQYVDAAAVGWQEVGLGVLFGVAPDLAMELACLAAHAQLLVEECGVQRVAISMPRLMPGAGASEQSRCSDEEFLKAFFTLRLLIPHAVLVLTARESADMRDRLKRYVGSIGVGGSTKPGGYTLDPDPVIDGREGQQFGLSDVDTLAQLKQRWSI